MSDRTEISLQVHSPRWGKSTSYSLVFTTDKLVFSDSHGAAECTHIPDRDPEWSGKTVFDIASENTVYLPHAFQDTIRWAWQQWRADEITDEELEREFKQIEAWIDGTSASMPKSNFWQTYIR